ncbi:MAG: hypothetical protein E6I62_07600 [Chloroflexi bacterium]|nr:MAG: hypothetical protein E6I62_07600 [Chloroflexota bacterium]
MSRECCPPGHRRFPGSRSVAEAQPQVLLGRAVLEDRVMAARLVVAAGRVEEIVEDAAGARGPYLAPGFVDVHVHGWGGHDAMGDEAALDGMARALLRHGVTSFVPAAVTSPLDRLAIFADRVRRWMPAAPEDGAEPLGFNIEGPCISPEKKGAQNEAFIQLPSAVPRSALEPMLDGLRLMTVAPERDGALDLVRWLAAAGVNVSLGHSNATAAEGAEGYAAGQRRRLRRAGRRRPARRALCLADHPARQACQPPDPGQRRHRSGGHGRRANEDRGAGSRGPGRRVPPRLGRTPGWQCDRARYRGSEPSRRRGATAAGRASREPQPPGAARRHRPRLHRAGPAR